MRARASARLRKAGWVPALLLAALGTPGCYTAQQSLLKSGLDSLRTQVEAMAVRDSVSAQIVADTQRDLAEQKDLILATRATATSTSRETAESLDRMEGKLDDIMARFRIASERAPVRIPAGLATPATSDSGASTAKPAATSTANPTQAYDQATTDLTQGRYAMALAGYRNFLAKNPDADLADNAQYGAGECFFAQARFDSALVEYKQVGARWPNGDRAAAALYKVGLCQERLGRKDEAKQTFEDLVKRFPQSGEAQLARDRIGVKL